MKVASATRFAASYRPTMIPPVSFGNARAARRRIFASALLLSSARKFPTSSANRTLRSAQFDDAESIRDATHAADAAIDEVDRVRA
jgi:hypothetical protein